MEEIEVHYLSDPQRWRDLLGYIRLGWGPHKASREIGTTKRALDAYLRLDPFKQEQFADAVDFWRETVEGKLHDAVTEGEPWAIQMTLKAELADKYGQKAALPTNVIVTSAAELQRLIEMAEQKPLPSVPISDDSGNDAGTDTGSN